VLSTAGGLLPGCGGDDPDVEQDAGSVTAAKDGGGKPVTPTQPTFAMDFVVSCTDSIDVGCAEFLGEKADAAKIKATTAKSCAQAGEEVKTERCPTDKLVGTCLGSAEIGGAKQWIKSFYYEPMTETMAKAICQGNKFESAK
jgi:hypothetical protein